MNSQRLKAFLRLFIPVLLAEMLLGALIYWHEMDLDKAIMRELDNHQLEQQVQLVESEMANIIVDLKLLSGSAELEHYLEKGDDKALDALASLFQRVAESRGVYYQIRYLDQSGMEKVRVNFQNGISHAVSAEALQNKSDRYYFTKSVKLDEYGIYVSPLDLNMEQGRIELPFKPMLRVVKPVVSGWNQRHGVLILNYLGASLLGKMQLESLDASRFSLLNQEGWWLYNEDIERRWGFMLEERKDQRFSLQFPAVWQLINAKDSGQEELAGGIYTWGRVNPVDMLNGMGAPDEQAAAESAGNQWLLVVHRSPESIMAATAKLRQRVYLSFYLLAMVTALVLYKIVDSRIGLAESKERERLLAEAKFFTNKLLHDALQEARSLEDELQSALEIIMEIPWVSILSKGSIFITDEKTGDLVMMAQKNLAAPLLTACARIRPGQCLCGRAAEQKEIIFTNCLDERHEITFEGMTEHGHICVPLMKSDEVLGVLNLYVEHQHEHKPIYREQMLSISYALSEVIERCMLDQRLHKTMQELEQQRDALEQERGIVEEVLMKIRSVEDFDINEMRYLMESVDNTAGDILLSCQRWDGSHHYLLGDFTGHGLPAAMASPVVADIFYSMTKKDIHPELILEEINKKLYERLPSHLFFAACFIEIDQQQRSARIWNAGLPDQILMREDVYRCSYPSDSLALGILKDWRPARVEPIPLQVGDRIFVFSDGLLEIADPKGEFFGAERLQEELSRIVREEGDLESLLTILTDYHGSVEHDDDISLLEVKISS